MAIKNPIPNFPFKAWFVGPSGKPRRLTLVRKSAFCAQWFYTAEGTVYAGKALFRKEDEAWEAGAGRLADRQAKLTKMQTSLNKHLEQFAAARIK